MDRSPALALPISMAIHVAAIALVLGLIGREPFSGILFVELTEPAVIGESSTAPRPVDPPAAYGKARRPPRETEITGRAAPVTKGADAAEESRAPETSARPDRTGVREPLLPDTTRAIDGALEAPTIQPTRTRDEEARIADVTVPSAPAPPSASPGFGSSTAAGARADSSPSMSAADAGRASYSPRGPADGQVGAPGGRSVLGPRGGIAGTPSESANGVATARSTGAPGSSSEYGAYLALVRRRLQETLEYPPVARRRSLAGTVHVEILVRPDGTVGDVGVVASSSHRVLDDAAVEALRRLPPVPFPPGLPPRTLRARLPVVFELH